MNNSIVLDQLDIARVYNELNSGESVWLSTQSASKTLLDVPLAISQSMKVVVAVEKAELAERLMEHAKTRVGRGSRSVRYTSQRKLYLELLGNKGVFESDMLLVFDQVDQQSLHLDLIYAMWRAQPVGERPRLLFLGSKLPERFYAAVEIEVNRSSPYVLKRYAENMPGGDRRKFRNIYQATIVETKDNREMIPGVILVFAPNDKMVRKLTEDLLKIFDTEDDHERRTRIKSKESEDQAGRLVQGRRLQYSKLPKTSQKEARVDDRSVIGLAHPVSAQDMQRLHRLSDPQARNLVIVATDRTAVVVPTQYLCAVVDTGLESYKEYTSWGKARYRVDIARKKTSDARMAVLDGAGRGIGHSVIPEKERPIFFSYHNYRLEQLYKPVLEAIAAGVDPEVFRRMLLRYEDVIRNLVAFGFLEVTRVQGGKRYGVVRQPHYVSASLSYLHARLIRDKTSDGGRLVVNMAVATIANFRYGLLYYPDNVINTEQQRVRYQEEMRFNLYMRPQPLETSLQVLIAADPARYIRMRSLPQALREMPPRPDDDPSTPRAEFARQIEHYKAQRQRWKALDAKHLHTARRYAKDVARAMGLRANELQDTLEDVYQLSRSHSLENATVTTEDVRMFFLRFPRAYAQIFPDRRFEAANADQTHTSDSNRLYVANTRKGSSGNRYKLDTKMSELSKASAYVSEFWSKPFDNVYALARDLDIKNRKKRGYGGFIGFWVAVPPETDVVFDLFPKGDTAKIVTTGRVVFEDYEPPARLPVPSYELSGGDMPSTTTRELQSIDFSIFKSMKGLLADPAQLVELAAFASHSTRRSVEDVVAELAETMEYPDEFYSALESDFWSTDLLQDIVLSSYTIPRYETPARFYAGGRHEYFTLASSLGRRKIDTLHLKEIAPSMRLYPRIRNAGEADPSGRTAEEIWQSSKTELLRRFVTSDGILMGRELTQELNNPRALRMFHMSWFRMLISLIGYRPDSMQSVLDLYSGWGAVAEAAWLLDWTYQGVYTLSDQDEHMKSFFAQMQSDRHYTLGVGDVQPFVEETFSLVVADVPYHQEKVWLEEEEPPLPKEGFVGTLETLKETLAEGLSRLKIAGWLVLRCENVIMRNALGKYIDNFPNMAYRGVVRVENDVVSIQSEIEGRDPDVIPEGEYLFLWTKRSLGKTMMRFPWDDELPGV